MDPADFEAALDRELKALPQLHAPRQLLPRIMAATSAPRPTGWMTWPAVWQAASAAMLLAVVAGLWMLAAAPPKPVADAARTAGEAATIMRALWEVFLQPVGTYVLALGVGLTLTAALVWAALEFALGGASQR